MITQVKKGDRFTYGSLRIEVTRKSKTDDWADIKVTSTSDAVTWTKRQRLPFPGTFQAVSA